jgi:hypothetical protein
MSWFLSAGEITTGMVLFAALVIAISLLRPPAGELQERLIVRFPGAWIIVGLPLTFAFGASVALIAVGVYPLL